MPLCALALCRRPWVFLGHPGPPVSFSFLVDSFVLYVVGVKEVVLAQDVLDSCPAIVWVYCGLNGVFVRVFFWDFFWF